jgi:hypothetical protein
MTGQDKTRQDKTRRDKTRQDKTRQDKTRQENAKRDKTRQDNAKRDETRRQDKDKTRQGENKAGWKDIFATDNTELFGAAKALMERGVSMVIMSTKPLCSKKQLQLVSYFYTLLERFSYATFPCFFVVPVFD